MTEKRTAASAEATAPKKNFIKCCKTDDTKSPHGLSIAKSPRESLAEQTATLLLHLTKPVLSPAERRQGWRLFEFALRRYIDLKYGGVAL